MSEVIELKRSLELVEEIALKKSAWLTYAWEDNKSQDVDFVAQELESTGLDIKLDRWNLSAGKRLWEQIESFIQDSSKSDAWLFYATQASLGSEACKEEYAYALDRSLNARGENFPIIALFPATIDDNLIPAGIRTRLYVSLIDLYWKERVIAAVEEREPNILRTPIEPYAFEIHKLSQGHDSYAIEVRPRVGTWSPFFAAIPLEEKDTVCPEIHRGPMNRPFEISGILNNYFDKVVEYQHQKLWLMSAVDEATPTQSYYVFCKKLPSYLFFGVKDIKPQYIKWLTE